MITGKLRLFNHALPSRRLLFSTYLKPGIKAASTMAEAKVALFSSREYDESSFKRVLA